MSAKNVETIYPLSPMQQGMLFHSIYSPGEGLYLEQLNWTLHGELNVAALSRAWQQAIDRHQVLRAAFVWEGVDEPLQVIGARVSLPFAEQDWRGLAPEEQRARLDAFLAEDRRLGFDLSRAPLMRLTLVRMADDVYQLVWSHHHLLMDGWSSTVLINEVSSLYEAYRRDADLRLERPRPYGDYITWLRRQDLGAAERFWRETLKGFTPPAPLGDVQPAGGDEEGKSYDKKMVGLSEGATAALGALARRHQLTLNTVVQGAWAALLGRYSGDDDVVFGAVVSGRPAELPGVEKMVGLFINTLPVRVQLPPDAPLLPWLREMQDRQAAARQYEYTPLAQVQAWSDPKLFESVFVFENFPADFAAGGDSSPVEIRDVWIVERANYPLTLVAAPGRELKLLAFYDRGRFTDAAVERLLGHWRALLEDMAARPEVTLAQLSPLTEAERELILVGWDGRGDYAREESLLHKLFEEQAAARPEAEAVSLDGEAVSYRRLDEMSNQIAHGLAEGGGRGPVAVMLESGPLQVAALFGALKAGRPFVCLDQNYPPPRLAQILDDVRPDFVISDAASLDAFHELFGRLRESGAARLVELSAGGGAPRVRLDGPVVDGSRWLESNPTTAVDVTVQPSDPAYIVFTSGSTGQPKGIRQSHRAFCQFLDWQSNYFEMTAPRRIAQWAAITYDASYCEIFGALCYGATLCMAAPTTRFDPASLLRWVRRERVALLQVVPSFCRQLLQAVEAEGGRENPCPDLERLLLAGEVVTAELAEKCLRRLGPSCQLFNLYGPSESVLATCYPVRDVAGMRGAIPIGRAFEGRQIIILDDARQLCPVGVKGEIYIRSRFLTDGYLNRPAETERAYIQNPLHDDYPDPVYRTGDVGRWTEAGDVEFFGRKDQQVKIRGMRVELSEIEGALAGHEAVGECTVVAHDFGEGDQRLAAYVVRDPGHEDREEADAETGLTSFEAQYIEQCQAVYDEIYSLEGDYAVQEAGISVRAWTSSYTNLPLPEDEVLESVSDTVERILALRPRRVLEIGCGTGLLMSRIAPHCEHFCGTDLSRTSVEYLREQVARRGSALGNVSVEMAAAHECERVPHGPFDAVVMNLVTQHFPSVNYLMRVLESAARVVAPRGFVFVGGIRNYLLFEAFHASVQLEQSSASLTREQLRQQVLERMSAEKDLVIAPTFFPAFGRELPGVVRAEARPKGGRARNEITAYQYDVILHVGGGADAGPEVTWLDWRKEGLGLAALGRLLEERRPAALGVAGVPNARVARDVKAFELLTADGGPETAARLRKRLDESGDAGAVEPEELRDLARRLGYDADVSWAATDETGAYDVAFRRRGAAEGDGAGGAGAGAAPAFPRPRRADGGGRRPSAEYANNPLQGRFGGKLVPELRAFMRERLPEHMTPSSFIFLDALPRTRTGKIDRNALPVPKRQARDTGKEYVAPGTELESLLARVWQEILKVDRVGVHDHFFSLGGHSLLATQVVNRLREVCLVDLPLRVFFEAPTVAGLAEKVEETRRRARGETEKIGGLAERIKQLSPEQLRALLQEKRSAAE